jgi:PleD family two-component response regulator
MTSLDPCYVLVVDDDALMREHLSGVILNAGYGVHTACDSAEALRALEHSDYRVVITDWEMPGMNGVALCRSIRERTTGRYVFLMMLTVRSAHVDVVEGLEAGADDYIVKGTASEELVARLERGRRIIGYLDSCSRAQLRIRRAPATSGNRLQFDYERCLDLQAPFTIMLCEIDQFEQHEQRFGSGAVDRLMRALEGEISKSLLCSEWVAREAHGRLTVVLADTGLDGAQAVAARVRAAALETERRGSGLLPLQLRIGGAIFEPQRQVQPPALERILEHARRSLGEARLAEGGTVLARVE